MMREREFPSPGPASQDFSDTGDMKGQQYGNGLFQGRISTSLFILIFALPKCGKEILRKFPGLCGSVKVGKGDGESRLNKIQ